MTMLGIKHREETKKKISESHKGKKKPWAGKYEHSKLSQEHKENIGKGLTGRVITDETKEKIRQSLIGHKHSYETIKKMSIGRKGKMKGKDHWLWNEGSSYEPYTNEWTPDLKASIRERDDFCCQVCGILENDLAHDIHHIDYNKKNCDFDNLITLCKKCHTGTNGTNINRDCWKNYFQTALAKLKELENG